MRAGRGSVLCSGDGACAGNCPPRPRPAASPGPGPGREGHPGLELRSARHPEGRREGGTLARPNQWRVRPSTRSRGIARTLGWQVGVLVTLCPQQPRQLLHLTGAGAGPGEGRGDQAGVPSGSGSVGKEEPTRRGVGVGGTLGRLMPSAPMLAPGQAGKGTKLETAMLGRDGIAEWPSLLLFPPEPTDPQPSSSPTLGPLPRPGGGGCPGPSGLSHASP